MSARVPRRVWARAALVVPAAAGVGALLWWRGPNWHTVADAFGYVRWEWVVGAIGLNLVSVVVRAAAWRTVIATAMPPPHPRVRLVFSAFSVGLFANAVLPGRIGELARVAVLTRKLPPRRGIWATLVGTVFAHRLFDLVPSVMLIVAVLATAKIPQWAFASLFAVVAAGTALFVVAFVSARLHHTLRIDEAAGVVRRVLTMARHGLGVLRAPLPAAIAVFFQCMGWFTQLLAVWTAMRAFQIHQPLAVAALVLLLMNVATILPLWPGNVGLLQAAIALPLVGYGVDYGHGFAYGIGLQAIEASVGISVGTLFLAREGLSFAMLRVMPRATQAEVPQEAETEEQLSEPAGARGPR